MTLPHHKDGFCWYNDLSEAKPHYAPVKCYNILQFFSLRGRSTTISIGNIAPIHGISYCYFADGKYFMKHYRGWSYEDLYKSEDEALRILKARIDAKQVWLMFTLQNISDMTEALKRVYKSQFKEEGKLDYKLFIELMDVICKYEEYRDYGKNLTGFKTCCNIFDKKLNELWSKAKLNKK